MNILTRNLIRLNPKHINRIKEGKLTLEEVLYARECGYKITKNTPSFIIGMLLSSDYKESAQEELYNVLKLNPFFINKLREEDLNSEIIEYFIGELFSYGAFSDYKIDSKTPPFLFKSYNIEERVSGQYSPFEPYTPTKNQLLVILSKKSDGSYWHNMEKTLAHYDISRNNYSDKELEEIDKAIIDNIDSFNFNSKHINNEKFLFAYIEKKGFEGFKSDDYSRLFSVISDKNRLFQIIRKDKDNFNFRYLPMDFLKNIIQ